MAQAVLYCRNEKYIIPTSKESWTSCDGCYFDVYIHYYFLSGIHVALSGRFFADSFRVRDSMQIPTSEGNSAITKGSAEEGGKLAMTFS